MNLLKAIGSLSPSPESQNAEAVQEEKAPSPSAAANNSKSPQAENTYPNVMASVLERHEAISNRIKNRR